MLTDDKQTPFEQPPETISINEVAFMHQIIQACAQRGAFKPEEFKDIGVLNDKLKAMIEYAKSLEEAAKKANPDPDPDPEASETDEKVDGGGKAAASLDE